MMDHIALVTFNGYRCRISQSTRGQIHCFKYTDNSCDWQVFDPSDQESASDYILTPPPSHFYYVDFGPSQE